jgi:hypothetical protein
MKTRVSASRFYWKFKNVDFQKFLLSYGLYTEKSVFTSFGAVLLEIWYLQLNIYNGKSPNSHLLIRVVYHIRYFPCPM